MGQTNPVSLPAKGRINMPESFRVVVLISGGGTTLKNLLEKQTAGELPGVEFVHVVSNNPNAKGLAYAHQSEIEATVIEHQKFESVEAFSDAIFSLCRECQADLVIMGGFLRRVTIPDDFANRVVNIHPSLIPSFCGKGNYGIRVHKNVIDYGTKVSGCTVHFVDDQYDHGPIIAQDVVPVLPTDTPEDLARRVFKKECELYPQVIADLAAGRFAINGRLISRKSPHE